MAITQTKVTGRVALADDLNPTSGVVEFTLSGYDTFATTDAVILNTSRSATIDPATGEIDIDLFPNGDGGYGTHYIVRAVVYVDGVSSTVSLGFVTVPQTGPVDLNDILQINTPAEPTTSEYAALLTSSVAAAQAAAASAAAYAPYADRTAAIAATPDAAVQLIAVRQGRQTLNYVRDDSGTALTTADGQNWSPSGAAFVEHWGALADWDGTTGTDDTVAINAALAWFAADDGRHLIFGEGVFYYDGNAVLSGEKGDGTWRKFNRITMIGAIYHKDPGATTGNPIAWEISEFENLSLDLQTAGGGKLGDFSASAVTDGGTTFLQLHAVQWVPTFRVHAMNYEGRVIHTTSKAASASARVRNIDLMLMTGNRPDTSPTDAGRAKCGQPLCADNTTSFPSVGAWGRWQWRGEHSMYGALFVDMADVEQGWVEAGRTVNSPVLDLVGVNYYNGDTFYTAETDQASQMPALRLKSSANQATYRVFFDKVRTDFGYTGIEYEDGPANFVGLKISQIDGTLLSEAQIVLTNVLSSVHLGNISSKSSPTALRIVGACGVVEAHFAQTDNMSEDIFDLQGTVTRLSLTGTIGDTGAAFYPVNLGTSNNDVDMNLSIDASTAAAKVRIGFGGSNNIRLVGGKFSGSSPAFSSGRPEMVKNVKGLQTESYGVATIASGTNSVVVTHNLDLTAQMVLVTPRHAEVSDAIVTSLGATTFAIQVGSNTTADRTLYWECKTPLLRGDTNA